MAASSDSPAAGSTKPDQPDAVPEVDLAQALRDLARGEQAATAMEANLTNLESKLDALLAAFEELDEEKGAKSAEKTTQEDKDGER
ncbi:hypothetical protein TARUN_8480 [Trichoderma arundinaceum]|uniref:Uncharacterized protein n=1 Tax=Trichoderma arundinaceum TaxID=490622 RepID=A0A395NCS0_TRIAR|nr:hypothetical protein TARUN_8480 [Trichoderma arundinaceum]